MRLTRLGAASRLEQRMEKLVLHLAMPPCCPVAEWSGCHSGTFNQDQLLFKEGDGWLHAKKIPSLLTET